MPDKIPALGTQMYTPKILALLKTNTLAFVNNGNIVLEDLPFLTKCQDRNVPQRSLRHCKSDACLYAAYIPVYSYNQWNVITGKMSTTALPHKFMGDRNREEYISWATDTWDYCEVKGIVTTCPKCKTVQTKSITDAVSKVYGVNCYNCFKVATEKCYPCGEHFAASKITKVANHTGSNMNMCVDCLKLYAKTCPDCTRKVTVDALIDNIACVYCDQKPIQEYQFKPDPIFLLTKEPLTKPSPKDAPFLGMELEVEMKPAYTELRETIARRFKRDVNGFAYLKHDSSISCGFEIVTHPGSFDWWESKDNPLKKSIKKLAVTCESFWTESTGIHVHISKAAFTSLHLGKFCFFMGYNQPLTTTIAERYNKHHAPFSWDVSTQLQHTVATSGKDIDRHTAINLQNQNTVEVRIFKGNMSWSRILKDIEYVMAVYEFTKHPISGGLPEKNLGIAWKDDDVHKNAPLMSAQVFRGWVLGESKRFPNLAEYIRDYKRDN